MRGLVVFLIPPEKGVNGGVLSIFSQCKESRRFTDIHKSDVVLCTYPGEPSYRQNDLFDNDEVILSFDEVVAQYPSPGSLIVHVPEYAVSEVYSGFGRYRDYL